MRKLVYLLLACWLTVACKKIVLIDAYHSDMTSFYKESCKLSSVTMDSIKRFSAKVNNYTDEFPEAKSDSLYPIIQENIRSATLRLQLEADTTWDGEIYINFGFRDE